MRLIDQKYIIPFDPFRKKSPQIYLWIKYIIIVTDYPIYPVGKIQTHLIRADLIFFRVGKQHLPVIDLFFLQKFKYRIIYPVKMSLGSRTCCRIALHVFTHAQLFFCCEKQGFPPKSMLFQNLKCLPCNRPGNCFCRQVKDFFRDSFSHGTHGRIQTRHRFSHTGRCLDKQLLFPQDRPVNTMHQISLPLPVREREFQPRHGCIPFFFPLLMPVRPDIVGIGKFLKPIFQFLCIKQIRKPADLLCLHIAVGHLHFHLFLLILFRIDCRIAFCLREMNQHRFFHIP